MMRVAQGRAVNRRQWHCGPWRSARAGSDQKDQPFTQHGETGDQNTLITAALIATPNGRTNMVGRLAGRHNT